MGMIQMGPLVVLISLLRENVINARLLLISFLKPNFQMSPIKKRLFFELLYIFFIHQGKDTKNSFSTYLTYVDTLFCSPVVLANFAFPILQKLRIQYAWCNGMSPGAFSYYRHFRIINK